MVNALNYCIENVNYVLLPWMPRMKMDDPTFKTFTHSLGLDLWTNNLPEISLALEIHLTSSSSVRRRVSRTRKGDMEFDHVACTAPRVISL